jgi:hypothetical protein
MVALAVTELFFDGDAVAFEGVTDRTGMDPKVFGPVFQTGFRIVPHRLPQPFWVELTATLGNDCPGQRGTLSPTVDSGRTHLKKRRCFLDRMPLLYAGDHPLTKV